MLSEYSVVLDPDDVVRIVRIILFQMLENFELNTCLMLESFLVSNQLHCYNLLSLVIKAFQCLAERALS